MTTSGHGSVPEMPAPPGAGAGPVGTGVGAPAVPAGYPGGGPDAPAPPPGPGVTPPFAAPPADRSRRGLWIGLGIGAVTLVVCCVGGIFGFGLLMVSTSEQVERQAGVVVREYLDALRDGEYDVAYQLLCPGLTRNTSLNDFAARERSQPRPVAYELGPAQFSEAIVVTAEIRLEGGDTATRRFELTQEFGRQELRICRIT